MSIERFSFPTTVHFGPGAAQTGRRTPEGAGIARRCWLPIRGVAALPLLGALVADLPASIVAVFSEIFAILCAASDGRRGRVQGASRGCGHRLVAARRRARRRQAVALMAHHDGDILEYAWDHPHVRAITQPIPWFVALPLTAGTGSGSGPLASVVGDDVTHVKKIIFSPLLLAKAVFADPELTWTCPPRSPRRRHGCVDAQRRVVSVAGLPSAVRRHRAGRGAHRRAGAAARRERGHDLDARSDMLMSSMMGAIAFQKDLGAVHSCAHALSTVADLHHGLANGIMIDHVMRFNLPAATRKWPSCARAPPFRARKTAPRKRARLRSSHG
jgi:hypothetical protein